MITEKNLIRMRGPLSAIRTVQNDVRIVVTGRKDLTRLADIFDAAADAAAGTHNETGRRATAAACRKMALLPKGKVTLKMPTAIWDRVKQKTP